MTSNNNYGTSSNYQSLPTSEPVSTSSSSTYQQPPLSSGAHPFYVTEQTKKPINRKPFYIFGGITLFFLVVAIGLTIGFIVEDQICTEKEIAYAKKHNRPVGVTAPVSAECYTALTLLFCMVAFFGVSIVGCCVLCCIAISQNAFSR